MANKKKELNNKLTNKTYQKSTSNTKKVIKVKNNIDNNVKLKKNKYTKIYENNKLVVKKKNNKTSNKPEIENVKLNLKELESKKDSLVLQKQKRQTSVKQAPKKTKRGLKVKETFSSAKKNLTIKLGKIKLSKLKRILFIFIIVFIAVGLLIFFLRENPAKVLNIYKKYQIGDKITDKGKTWYVIEDSGSNDNLLKLISSKPLDLNNDGKINDKDKVAFDTKGNYELNSEDKNNIGYLLNNTYSLLIDFSGKIDNMTLLTSEQYIKIRKSLNLDYTWDKSNWLASKDIGIYWLNTSNNKKVYAVNTNGSYRLENATKKYYLRPVITVHKTEIK